MALDHSQERITHPGFIDHDHAHSYLPPGGSRGWPVSPVATVPVPLATASLLPTEIGFGASAPPSGLWGVDASNQPPRDPSFSAPPAMATSASSSSAVATSATSDITLVADLATASASMTSSTTSPVLTAYDIMRIVNKRVNAGLAAAASAVPVKDPPHGFKLNTFSGTSKDWLDYDRSLTYTMEMPLFAPATAEIKTTVDNAIQISQLCTASNTAIYGDARTHFNSRDNLVRKGFKMVSTLRTTYAPTGNEAVFANFNQIFGLDMQYGEELANYMSHIRHIHNLLLEGGIKLPSILLNMFSVKGLGIKYTPVKKEFAFSRSLFTSLNLEGINIKCTTYTSAAAAIADNPDTYKSAAGNAAAPQAPTPNPTPAPTAGVSTFPPSRPLQGRKVTSLM